MKFGLRLQAIYYRAARPILFSSLFFLTAVNAAAEESQNTYKLQDGNPTAGEKIAAQCSGCHGMKGTAPPTDQFPFLDGQLSKYMQKQLQDFASGKRSHEIMSPIAKQLNIKQIADVSAYYASFNNERPQAADMTPAETKRVTQLVRLGDNELVVQGCSNCHGPAGEGASPQIPLLKGQKKSYLLAQLKAFKHHTRSNDLGARMTVVAEKLPEAEMELLARYYSDLR